jgi:hypothetical protein
MDATEVDAFLTAVKHLAGEPQWEALPRTDQFRLVWPLAVRGEILGPSLFLRFAAAAPQLALSIGLNIPPVIQRLDLNARKGHNNGLRPPTGIAPGKIVGSNYHPWWANRAPATKGGLPRNLRYAVPYDGPESYEGAFSWFCNASNIQFSSLSLPALPPRGTLL